MPSLMFSLSLALFFLHVVFGASVPRTLEHRQSLTSRANAALPPGWSKYGATGCYSDASSSRSLNGYSAIAINNLTPNSCINICVNKGFTFSGVEYGGECYCGSSLSAGASSRAVTDCSQACTGDSSQTCGNTYRIQVVSYTAPSAWTRLGCYTDSSTRALSAYGITGQTANTPASCQATCTSRGYTFAGVEYGGECYCANAISTGSGYGQLASPSDCSMACTGDSSQTCGGNYRIAIYQKSAGSPTTTSTTSKASSTSTSTTSKPTTTTTMTTTSKVTTTSTTTTTSKTTTATTATTTTMTTSSKPTTTTTTIMATSTSTSVPTSSKPTTTTAISTSTGTSTSSSSTPSSTIPASSGKAVVAHHMVGNTYSYTQATWLSNIQAAVAGGIDGFALNVGVDYWQPSRVADAYAAALSSGTGFKLFLSFDVSSLPCASTGDATIFRTYLNTYATHPNQYFYGGKQFASTFAGENCRFGQGDLNSAWNYALKTGVTNPVAFVPSFFTDPSSFGSMPVMDGEFNWNGGWPSGDFDTSFDTDTNYINNLGGRYYIAPVTPLFFTHYGANSYNKNWIYRSDDWLYNTRWELLIANRAKIDLVEIISWNDYGESHYIGPIGADQPNSQSWVDGFDHTAWTTMTNYYATAWKTGSYPAITKDQIYLSARPHSRDATTNDPAGKPSNWQWTDDYLYAVVFATTSSSLKLTIGASSSVTAITPGVNKIKLALSPGSPRAILTNSATNAVIVDFSPSGFTYTATPTAYNFNYYMQVSP